MLVARRDRSDRNGGGVYFYVRNENRCVNHIANSTLFERTWLYIHTFTGIVVCCLWYRPPDSEAADVISFKDELALHAQGCSGIIVLGDLNVHHAKWLRYSARNSRDGEVLRNTCVDYNLVQLVRKPTRGDYLLDLVMTNLENAHAVVQPSICDHAVVTASFKFNVPLIKHVQRTLWDFKRSNWSKLRSALSDMKWSDVITGNPDSAAKAFADIILSTASANIPRRIATVAKSSHPWINEKCIEAISKKCQAHGTDTFQEASIRCSQTLQAEFTCFVERCSSTLKSLSKGDKKWWKITRALMFHKNKVSGIPPLFDREEQVWVHEARSKAQLFMQVFLRKFQLPPRTKELEQPHDKITSPSSLPVIRKRWARRVLKNIDVTKATGPDMIPGRILKECWQVLAFPLCLLTRLILASGIWPQLWKHHWILPLFKNKGASHDADKYRGIHITSILAKCVERLLKIIIVPQLERVNAFGANQWAYRHGHSSKDLLALLLTTWILALGTGSKIAIYLSDIVGAFDHVDANALISKYMRLGLPIDICKVLLNFFGPRTANVIVDGSMSDVFVLQDMVFQGTVSGPPSWNVFFADVADVVTKRELKEAIFADDMTAYRQFPAFMSNSQILDCLRDCQKAVHEWGAASRVEFDPSKEAFVILHRTQNYGDTFKLLGTLVDTKLVMQDAVEAIFAKAFPKLKALLRTSRFLTKRDMITQYKSHILCILECFTPAIYHASNSVLIRLDDIQRHFLHAIDTSDVDAFLLHNLAPLGMRRDIAMLGLLHKCVLGEAHPQLIALFRPAELCVDRRSSRLNANLHTKQLMPYCTGNHTEYMKRSLLGLVDVYNRLPQDVVDCVSVTSFQSHLTKIAKETCSTLRRDWQIIYKP